MSQYELEQLSQSKGTSSKDSLGDSLLSKHAWDNKKALPTDLTNASSESESCLADEIEADSCFFLSTFQRKSILWCLLWISTIALYIFSFIVIHRKYSHFGEISQFEEYLPLDTLSPYQVDRFSKRASNHLDFIVNALFLGKGNEISKKDVKSFSLALHKNLNRVIEGLTAPVHRNRSIEEGVTPIIQLNASTLGENQTRVALPASPTKAPSRTSSLSPARDSLTVIPPKEDKTVLESEPSSGTKRRAKFAVSISLQLGPSFALGMGLVHVLAIWHTLRMFDADKIDVVVWLTDPKHRELSPKEICGEKVWKWLQTIPGFFVEGGSLCSEFGIKPDQIHVTFHGRLVANVIIAQMTKVKAIALDMYDRVTQLDWDTLPYRPFLPMFGEEMNGVKVMAKTDDLGPLYGSAVLIQPSWADYKSICVDVLGKIGFHDYSSGWNNIGQILSPFCPHGPSNPQWGICDPPQYIDWGFHAGGSDQGLLLYYYGIMHDWLITIGPGYNKTDMRYYRKFGSEQFEGGVWNGVGLSGYRHYKGNKKAERMLADYTWRETMYAAYHRLNMSQVELFKTVYDKMLEYSHINRNTWEAG